MPPKLQQSNAKHYNDKVLTEVVEFDGPHLLPSRENWEEVADHALAGRLSTPGDRHPDHPHRGPTTLTDPTSDPRPAVRVQPGSDGYRVADLPGLEIATPARHGAERAGHRAGRSPGGPVTGRSDHRAVRSPGGPITGRARSAACCGSGCCGSGETVQTTYVRGFAGCRSVDLCRRRSGRGAGPGD